MHLFCPVRIKMTIYFPVEKSGCIIQKQIFKRRPAWTVWGCMLLLVSCIAFAAPFNRPAWVVSSPNETLDADVEAIRWVHFDIPATALEQAMNYDVNSQNSGYPLNWIRLLAVLGAKYGGDFTRYQSKDLEQLVYRLQNGESLSDITADLSNYDYYVRAYGAVLDGFLGEYAVRIPAEDGSLRWETRYGLKVYSPLPADFITIITMISVLTAPMDTTGSTWGMI